MEKLIYEKIIQKLEKKPDALKRYIPEEFPHAEELQALYEKDAEWTVIMLVWLTELSGRKIEEGEEEDYLYARRMVRENVISQAEYDMEKAKAKKKK